ncbi:hypothetical protein DUI87_11579 [Hirundo rustica rustica]|uniref:Uncharacterized protein n=1 Tax=Hirundo rustica rustica TaxID=333673 RepID=A0A3M0KKJ2_HIRRU|nr:hypothetical protein DUI87_11579 [Hirundo rustica rustica]
MDPAEAVLQEKALKFMDDSSEVYCSSALLQLFLQASIKTLQVFLLTRKYSYNLTDLKIRIYVETIKGPSVRGHMLVLD